MLTADLVHVRRRGDALQIVPLTDDERLRAGELAAAYVDLARAHVGLERAVLLEALRQVPVAARERRIADGLLKLVLDRCVFQPTSAVEPTALRAELFTRAAAVRRGLAAGGAFDRGALVAEVAAAMVITPEELEGALYADLPDSHLLRAVDVPGPRSIVDEYERGQVQAVLLRAVKVRAQVFSARPDAYRRLFRKLKFLRLLHQIRRLDGDRGYEIDIDGPFSLFESVTKYGLQLALAFPALAECDSWRLEAELRWGKARLPLRLRLAGGPGTARSGEEGPAPVPHELTALLAQLEAAAGPWRASPSDAILDLPGIGLCVPDLELVHAETEQKVHVEILGFWSREAVWKRIELVEQGLLAPIVFAVSKHLRVSEAALGADLPAALCVYAKTLTARALLDRVEAVAARTAPPTPAALPKRPSRARRQV